MSKLLNLLRGAVTIEVTGVELERFLNACAQQNLIFWNIWRKDAFLLHLSVTRRHVKALVAVAERFGCEVEIMGRRGLPFFLGRFRRRYALLAGLLLCMGVLSVGSRTLLLIEISGNETVTTAEILSVLRQHGIRPGIYTPSVERGLLANEMLLDMDQLSFFVINFHGIRGEVIVREKVPAPELLNEREIMDVVSTATGIITKVERLAGDCLVQEGQTVVEGEVLISGMIDIKEPEYAETDLGVSYTHARGNIYARTWRTLEAKSPLVAQVKELTGEEESRYALNILGTRLKFYRNGGISLGRYDKITESKTITLSDGGILPFSLEKETCRAYVTNQVQLDEYALEELLRAQLLERLAEEMGEGEVLHTDFICRKADGFMEVTLLAECSEQIGKEVPRQVEAPPEKSEESEA